MLRKRALHEERFDTGLTRDLVPKSAMPIVLGRYDFAGSFVDGKKVLEVGCNTGYGSGYLAGRGAKLVVAVDYAMNAVLYAKEHFGNSVSFAICDGLLLPFASETFDVVVSLEVIEHMTYDEQRNFLKECKRVLAPGGLFICSTPNKERIPKIAVKLKPLASLSIFVRPEHVGELSLKEFTSLIGNYFSIQQLYACNPIKNRAAYKYIEHVKVANFLLTEGYKLMQAAKSLLSLTFKALLPRRQRLVKMTDLGETIVDERFLPFKLSEATYYFDTMFCVASKERENL